MAVYGYHRTSTKEQHLDRGIIAIKDFCIKNGLELAKIFTDQQTGKNTHSDHVKLDFHMVVHNLCKQKHGEQQHQDDKIAVYRTKIAPERHAKCHSCRPNDQSGVAHQASPEQ